MNNITDNNNWCYTINMLPAGEKLKESLKEFEVLEDNLKGTVSNRAALFCSSPLLTQWPYTRKAQASIRLRTKRFSYGTLPILASVMVLGDLIIF